jgi:hypothetical protein
MNYLGEKNVDKITSCKGEIVLHGLYHENTNDFPSSHLSGRLFEAFGVKPVLWCSIMMNSSSSFISYIY